VHLGPVCATSFKSPPEVSHFGLVLTCTNEGWITVLTNSNAVQCK
jgi:hypothetical protein